MNVVNIGTKTIPDSELLGEGMSYLAEACARFMEIKHKEGHTLFRMTDAILFYIENYLVIDSSGLSRPTNEWAEELENDDSA